MTSTAARRRGRKADGLLSDGFPIGESALLTEGIRMLPPGRKIRAFFDTSHERINTDLPMRYDVTVRLRDARGRKQPDQQYTIDMGYMYGTTQIREYGLHDAAKAISEIQKSVKKWSDIHGASQGVGAR